MIDFFSTQRAQSFAKFYSALNKRRRHIHGIVTSFKRYCLAASPQRFSRKLCETLRPLRFIFFLFMLSSITIAHAEPSTYSPEFCEFAVTFPEEPYKTERCDGDTGQCYEQVSFTKVFALSSTVNFRVICNEVGADIKGAYDGDVMKATLRAMTDRSVVKTFETSFREEETYKQAGLVGEGKVGRTPTIYIAQLWIGETSAFSVEAELIGEAGVEADTMFSEVLRSVGVKVVGEEAEDTEAKELPKIETEDLTEQ